MSEKTNISWLSMSDRAIIESLGLFVKHHRLEQNRTQQELAVASGINRSTLNQVESGKAGSLLTLIQLLRALNQLAVLDAFEIVTPISPLQLAKLEQKKRKRASGNNQGNHNPKSSW
jgi:transcriptional regulator with XRE-family HTH domain